VGSDAGRNKVPGEPGGRQLRLIPTGAVPLQRSSMLIVNGFFFAAAASRLKRHWICLRADINPAHNQMGCDSYAQ